MAKHERDFMKKVLVMTVSTLLFAASSALAIGPQITKEERMKMSDMHTQMASCLKSEKPMMDCQSEMMKSCEGMRGKEACPMMGAMHGKMRDGMMKGGGMMGQGTAENMPAKNPKK